MTNQPSKLTRDPILVGDFPMAEKARKWCFEKRGDPKLGPMIQELQSWVPAALYFVLAAYAAELREQALDLANDEYNKLRKNLGYPPLDNKGRWIFEAERAKLGSGK